MLVGELKVYPSSVRPSSSSTFSNMNISATSGSITLKAYQRDRGKAALDFGPDQIKYSGFDGNRLLP